MKHHNVWIRLAGHAGRIRENQPNHWRCYINRNLPEIPLTHWRLIGMASPDNVVPGTNHAKDHLGLNAWMDFYGDITVDEQGLATIELKQPKT